MAAIQLDQFTEVSTAFTAHAMRTTLASFFPVALGKQPTPQCFMINAQPLLGQFSVAKVGPKSCG